MKSIVLHWHPDHRPSFDLSLRRVCSHCEFIDIPIHSNAVMHFIKAVSAGCLILASRAAADSAPLAGNVAGCYDSPGDLKNMGFNTYQTQGLCQTTCTNAGFPVWAVTKGSTCYCGSCVPAS